MMSEELERTIRHEPKPEAPEDDEEFQRVLRNLVKTPLKPHEPLNKGREPKSSPKEKAP